MAKHKFYTTTKCGFFFCNLFIFKDMHIQFYTDKVHLIYQNKHFATLH